MYYDQSSYNEEARARDNEEARPMPSWLHVQQQESVEHRQEERENRILGAKLRRMCGQVQRSRRRVSRGRVQRENLSNNRGILLHSIDRL